LAYGAAAIDLVGQGAEAVDAGIRFGFGGVRAATLNRQALQKAQDALAKGKNPEAVRKTTGFFVGDDGKWRFEIDDSQAELNMDVFTEDPDTGIKTFKGSLISYTDEQTGIHRKGVLSHEILEKAYPSLAFVVADITINPNRDSHPTKALRGQYTPRGGLASTEKIEVWRMNEENAISTLMHEVQHAIQHVEDFSYGGSPKTVRRIIDELKETKRILNGAYKVHQSG